MNDAHRPIKRAARRVAGLENLTPAQRNHVTYWRLMRHYYHRRPDPRGRSTAAGVAAPTGLMRRAAYGLATAIARELAARTGGIAGGTSARSSAPGTTAATRCGRRRSCVAAARPPQRCCSIPERTHKKALAAFTGAGGRVVESVPTTTDLVIDGVVGISGSGPLRPNAAEVFATVDEPASRWWPSISPAAST